MIEEYRTALKEKFNIELACQPPNSPEPNVLDLGIWMSLQAMVDRLARDKRTNTAALDATVRDAWERYDEVCEGLTMATVWAKLEDIARVVIAADGDNDNDEGKNAGAKKRVRAEYDAIMAARRSAPSAATSDSDESDRDADAGPEVEEDEDE